MVASKNIDVKALKKEIRILSQVKLKLAVWLDGLFSRVIVNTCQTGVTWLVIKWSVKSIRFHTEEAAKVVNVKYLILPWQPALAHVLRHRNFYFFQQVQIKPAMNQTSNYTRVCKVSDVLFPQSKCWISELRSHFMPLTITFSLQPEFLIVL